MSRAIPQLLDSVSRELKALEIARQRYAKQLAPNFSVFDYIYTDEIMLSKIIADLLNPYGEHAQGSLFLSLFLKQLTLNETWENIDLGYAKITVQTEKLTAENRRMDIYIHIQTKEQSFGICIENKPFAADGNKQLIDYATEMKRLHRQNWHIVYLSGYGNQPAEYSVSTENLELWKENHQFS
jgi:hypothetical protein